MQLIDLCRFVLGFLCLSFLLGEKLACTRLYVGLMTRENDSEIFKGTTMRLNFDYSLNIAITRHCESCVIENPYYAPPNPRFKLVNSEIHCTESRYICLCLHLTTQCNL